MTKKIVLLVSIIVSVLAYSRSKPFPINDLYSNNKELINLISNIHQQPIYQYYNLEKIIFIIDIKQHNNGSYILEISIAYKQDMDYLLKKKKQTLYGYFGGYIYPVFVFSDRGDNPFFYKTNKMVKIPWLTIKKEKKYKIPPPPIIYEPPIWVYRFTNNIFELVGCRNLDPSECECPAHTQKSQKFAQAGRKINLSR